MFGGIELWLAKLSFVGLGFTVLCWIWSGQVGLGLVGLGWIGVG